MNKRKKILSCALAAASMLSVMPASIKATDEGTKTEWVQEGSDWFVKLNDEKIKGWYKDEYQCWYLLDFTTAAMRRGWVAGDSTHWYYFKPSNGQMVTGWQDIEGTKYYFLTSGKYAGAMATGDVEVEGKTLRFNSKGAYVGEVVNGVVMSENRETPIWSGYALMDNLIEKIFSEILTEDMSEIDELRAIYKWVAENIDYGYKNQDTWVLTKDFGECDLEKRHVPIEMDLAYNKSYYSDTYNMMMTGGGVCNDYAQIFDVLVAARGFRATIFGGRGNKGVGHAVAAVWYDGCYRLVDCDVAADTRPISYDYFMKDNLSYFELNKTYDLSDPNYEEIQRLYWKTGKLDKIVQ